MRHVRVLVGTAIGLALASAATRASAGNEDSFLYGDQASLTGGAVVASIRDTAAIWYNPAGLGLNRRGRLELSGTAFLLRWRRIPEGLALDLPTKRVERHIESKELAIVPTSLAIVRELGKGFSVGLGLFVTEQDIFNFQHTAQTNDGTVDLEVSGALTGTNLRYHAGPSFGWQVMPELRVGATLFAVYETYHEFRKFFADARMTGTYESTFLQRLVDAHATRLGSELVIGAQLEPGDAWELGLAIRSPRYVFYEHDETDNSTAFVSQGPGAPTVAASNVDHNPIGAEGTGFSRPPRFTGGAAKRLGAFELSGELEVRPAGIGGVYADRPVVNARAGALWLAAENTSFGVGVFSDRSGAAPPATFPESRVDYYGIAAGWKQHHALKLRKGEEASSLLFSTTVAVRYAVGLGESTRIRFDFRNTPNDGLVGRVADERVDVVYHEASLYLGTGFEF